MSFSVKCNFILFYLTIYIYNRNHYWLDTVCKRHELNSPVASLFSFLYPQTILFVFKIYYLPSDYIAKVLCTVIRKVLRWFLPPETFETKGKLVGPFFLVMRDHNSTRDQNQYFQILFEINALPSQFQSIYDTLRRLLNNIVIVHHRKF